MDKETESPEKQLDKSTVARGIAWNMAFAAPAKIAFPVIGILIARSVGPQIVGVFAVLTTIFAVTELIREGGLGATYIADRKLTPERIQSYVAASIGSAALFAIVLVVARGTIARFFNLPQIEPALILAAMCVFLGGFVTIPSVTLQREVKFRELGFADLFATLASYAVALTLALLGYGLISLVAQLGVRVILFSILVLRIAKFVKPRFGKEAFEIIKSSTANLGANLAYFAYTSFDYFLVQKVVGDKGNGVYFAAFNIASKPVELITVPVNRPVVVAYARDNATPERQADIWTRTVGLLALVTLPLYGLLWAHANTIIDILYSKEFAASGPVLSILSIYLGCRAFGVAAGGALVATGRPKLHMMGWIMGYVVAGASLAATWQNATLLSIVWCLTAGAIAIYATLFIALAIAIPPSRVQAAVMFRRFGGGVVTAAAVICTKFLGVHPYAQLAIGLVGGACVHIWVMAQVLGQNPLKPGGLRSMLKAV